jgi:hypothetical protein
LTQPAVFAAEEDHSVVRYPPKTPFYPDPAQSPQQGTDAQGGAWQEAWGWLGSPRNPKRRYVRMITLERPAGEAICLVTELLAATQYPAADLLALDSLICRGVTRIRGRAGILGIPSQKGVESLCPHGPCTLSLHVWRSC